MARSLIIDGQILQTDGWYRGMGKYLLQVLGELSRNYTEDTEIALILNDNLLQDQQRFETLHYLFPNVKIMHWDLPVPDHKKPRKGAKQYQKQLTQYVDQNFPDTEKFYLMTALFLFDFFAEFPRGSRKLALFYDLTPLLFWRDLGGYFPRDLYMERFNRLYEAEHIFAISETTRQDLLNVFGLNPELVTNINGGFIKIAEEPIKPKGFTVPSKFVLFPTGNLPHKNNLLTVKAFNRYCLKNKDNTKLLITSHFSDEAKRHLTSQSKHIVFTDNVSDNELEWLYENAEAIIFSSKYEGLGMPILDAVANKKPVVASVIPVFKEMTRDAFYFFDHENIDDLEQQIEQALAKHGFKGKLQHYPDIMDKYTWAKTTDKIAAYVADNQKRPADHVPAAQSRPKPRIAVCSLSPGIKDQIGRLSEQLYFSLKDQFKIDYYFDSQGLNFRELERPTFLDLMDCQAFDITRLGLNTYPKYDLVVYIIDKAAIPSRVAQRAVVLPGVVISGDLSGLVSERKLMKQLILAKPNENYVYNAKGFTEYQNIASYLSAMVTRAREHQNAAVGILKKGGSKRKTIRRLKKIYEDDK